MCIGSEIRDRGLIEMGYRKDYELRLGFLPRERLL